MAQHSSREATGLERGEKRGRLLTPLPFAGVVSRDVFYVCLASIQTPSEPCCTRRPSWHDTRHNPLEQRGKTDSQQKSSSGSGIYILRIYIYMQPRCASSALSPSLHGPASVLSKGREHIRPHDPFAAPCSYYHRHDAHVRQQAATPLLTTPGTTSRPKYSKGQKKRTPMRTHAHAHLLGVLLPSRLVLRVRHVPEVVHLRPASHRGLVQSGVEGVLVDGGGAVEVELRVPPQGPLPAAVNVAAAVAVADPAGAAGVIGAGCAIRAKNNKDKGEREKRGKRRETKGRHVNRKERPVVLK